MNIYNQISLSQDEENNESNFIPMISEDDEPYLEQTDLPDTLPILPLRNMVLFPGVAMPVSVGRQKSLSLVREAYRQNTIIAAFTQKDAKVETRSRTTWWKWAWWRALSVFWKYPTIPPPSFYKPSTVVRWTSSLAANPI